MLIKRLFLWSIAICWSFLVSGQIITTVAGCGSCSALGDGGAATLASIGYPLGMAIDKQGNLYVTDNANSRVRKVDRITGIITTVAGTGVNGYNGDGIPATAAQLDIPGFVAFDSSDNLFIGTADFRIRKIGVTSGVISTFAGTGVGGYSSDGTLATAANILGNAFTLDKDNNFYLVELSHVPDTCFIRKIDTSGHLTTIAGSGISGCIGDGGLAIMAHIHIGWGICTDLQKNIYLPNASCASLRKITINTGIINRIAGTGDSVFGPYSGDGGPATDAHIDPVDACVDAIGNIFIADPGNQRIEMIDTFGNIHSIAGTGISGFSGDGGPATAAKFYAPRNVVLDQCGNLYIADYGNRRIRKIIFPHNSHVGLSGTTVMPIGSTVTVTANVANAGYSYSIKWYNKGVLFSTTTAPTVTYTKTIAIDSITAMVYGCSDSALSTVHIVADAHVGVPGMVAAEGIKLWPNPAGAVVNVSSAIPLQWVTISTPQGRTLSYQECHTKETTLTTAHLPPGLYLVRVADAEGHITTLKMTKE